MHNHESVHTQMYRGFKLKMFHDHANDPYHYMDGLWPMPPEVRKFPDRAYDFLNLFSNVQT